MLKQSIPCIDQLCLCVWEPPRPPASTGCHGGPGRQGEEGIVQARVSVRIPRPHRSFHMGMDTGMGMGMGTGMDEHDLHHTPDAWPSVPQHSRHGRLRVP